MNKGPSFLKYKSGWIAPKGLAGGAAEAPVSGVCDLGIKSGDKHLPKPIVVRGEAGIGELHELADPPVKEAKLDWEGEGVRTSSEVPGEEHRMSREAARRGEGERLVVRRG